MSKLNVKNRSIFCRDNIDILRGINSECIDLIYIDPPFNKKKVFTAPIGSSAEGASFKDYFREEDLRGEWLETIQEDHDELHNFLLGVKSLKKKYNFCYLAYMAIRILELHRILKDTGSLYLHCDPTMSHYLKLLLDYIFGEENFRNEIVWQRSNIGKGSQFESKKYGANTDILFFYTKTNRYHFKSTKKLSEEEINKKFNKIDKKGNRYNTTTPIFRSKSMGARPNLCFTWKGFKNPHPSGWRLSKRRLEEEYQKGNIVIQNGKIERRKYLNDYDGEPIGSNWIDISIASNKERTGYPTQKPLALLERIIKASSKKGGVVLDAFCGCATTCIASEKLERQWIGIDISIKAYELVKLRLKKEVANPEKLFDYNKEINFSTDPPKRTDRKRDDVGDKKYVYIISNPKYKKDYKVGVASNVKSRLNSYQTSDPNRGYKLEHSVHTSKYRELEKHIHSVFENNHEWVRASLEDIKKEFKNFLR